LADARGFRDFEKIARSLGRIRELPPQVYQSHDPHQHHRFHVGRPVRLPLVGDLFVFLLFAVELLQRRGQDLALDEGRLHFEQSALNRFP